MKRIIAIVMMCVSLSTAAKTPGLGKWLDTTADTRASSTLFIGLGKFLISEDYEVVSTHEVCASVDGYFLEKSQLGRYEVRFKGMRTYSTFIFTTQYDAEKWAEKFCTPESLTSINR